MENTVCHICDYQNNQTTFCERCGSNLSNSNEETIVLKASPSATYATADKMSSLRVNGFIYLTNKRLLIIPAKMSGFGLTSALTATVYNKMTTASGIISIPFEQMKLVRDGKFGLLVKALIIETTNGELVKMTLPKRNEWKDTIIKYMS